MRRTSSVAAVVCRERRLNTHGPSGSGCCASIWPRETARRKAPALISRKAAACVWFIQPSAAHRSLLKQGILWCVCKEVTRSRDHRLPRPVGRPLRFKALAIRRRLSEHGSRLQWNTGTPSRADVLRSQIGRPCQEDATDIATLRNRCYGRHVDKLYNEVHPHKSLRLKSPREFIRGYRQPATCPVG